MIAGQLFIATGSESRDNGKDVEVIDVSSSTPLPCFKPSDYPVTAYHTMGALIQGSPIVCGGHYQKSVYASCYSYSINNNTWTETFSLNTPRFVPTAVALSDSEFWITGGESRNGELLDTIEVYSPENGLSFSSIRLPQATRGHSLVKINSTSLFLTGGEGVTESAWILDVSSQEWIAQEPIDFSREGSFAGLVTRSNGEQEIVIAGGNNAASSEIFSLLTGSWRYGTNLPHFYRNGASVQNANASVAVGGYYADAEDTIYKNDPDEESWELLPTRLEGGRYWMTARLVPDGSFGC